MMTFGDYMIHKYNKINIHDPSDTHEHENKGIFIPNITILEN